MNSIQYDYQDADGSVRFRVTRSDYGAGKKSFTQAVGFQSAVVVASGFRIAECSRAS
jgi:hypothetical protein